ncbi:MAG: hypothetical protein KAS66_03060 [Candidatus Omnitrophica bacterium]|nr:hypothetical protein [Candidatus Omnitrophota bacterium]
MVLAGDPPEVNYGFDECGNCHAELDNGQHICMADFTVPSDGYVRMTVTRRGATVHNIILKKGDEIEFMPVEDE